MKIYPIFTQIFGGGGNASEDIQREQSKGGGRIKKREFAKMTLNNRWKGKIFAGGKAQQTGRGGQTLFLPHIEQVFPLY